MVNKLIATLLAMWGFNLPIILSMEIALLFQPIFSLSTTQNKNTAAPRNLVQVQPAPATLTTPPSRTGPSQYPRRPHRDLSVCGYNYRDGQGKNPLFIISYITFLAQVTSLDRAPNEIACESGQRCQYFTQSVHATAAYQGCCRDGEISNCKYNTRCVNYLDLRIAEDQISW